MKLADALTAYLNTEDSIAHRDLPVELLHAEVTDDLIHWLEINRVVEGDWARTQKKKGHEYKTAVKESFNLATAFHVGRDAARDQTNPQREAA